MVNAGLTMRRLLELIYERWQAFHRRGLGFGKPLRESQAAGPAGPSVCCRWQLLGGAPPPASRVTTRNERGQSHPRVRRVTNPRWGLENSGRLRRGLQVWGVGLKHAGKRSHTSLPPSRRVHKKKNSCSPVVICAALVTLLCFAWSVRKIPVLLL